MTIKCLKIASLLTVIAKDILGCFCCATKRINQSFTEILPIILSQI